MEMLKMTGTGRTITRADLADAVYQQVGLSRNESSELVETVLNEISKTLISGENVKISSFGSFSIRQKGERIGRNPKTGVEVPILPRKVLVFKASHVLKDRIAEGATSADSSSHDSEGGYSGGDDYSSGGNSGFYGGDDNY
jgi:integration host factor subunit alpha